TPYEWTATSRWPRATRIVRRKFLLRNTRREFHRGLPSAGKCGPTHTTSRQKSRARANDEKQRHNGAAIPAQIFRVHSQCLLVARQDQSKTQPNLFLSCSSLSSRPTSVRQTRC